MFLHLCEPVIEIARGNSTGLRQFRSSSALSAALPRNILDDRAAIARNAGTASDDCLGGLLQQAQNGDCLASSHDLLREELYGFEPASGKNLPNENKVAKP